jgi:hypothetical protein
MGRSPNVCPDPEVGTLFGRKIKTTASYSGEHRSGGCDFGPQNSSYLRFQMRDFLDF